MIEIYKTEKNNNCEAIFHLTDEENYKNLNFSDQELEFILKAQKNNEQIIILKQFPVKEIVHIAKSSKDKSQEEYRKLAFQLHEILHSNKIKSLFINDTLSSNKLTYAFLEGLLLSNYQFLKYFTKKEEKKYLFSNISLKSENITKQEIEELTFISQGVFYARDMVNEPVSYLNAPKMAEEIVKLGALSGFSVEVLGKEKLEELKMGGLLAVNKGSIDPPCFSILEWNPKNKKNSKPIVFIGKGIVYDTGGLSLKPTPGSMDIMKSDMGGAAAVIGAMYSIAKAKLDCHVIALIPSTDNRPGGNAYAPGDVINMFDGTTVEVMNTDAEGRMILADAISYAKKYNPAFVLDIATLTGSAVMALGHFASIVVGNKEARVNIDNLVNHGNNIHERLVEFPFWDDFAELLKSDIADLKNLGSREAGAITAGKFLEHFTSFPWAHIDIAGTAFLATKQSYLGKGATGVGVRLLYQFAKNYQTT